MTEREAFEAWAEPGALFNLTPDPDTSCGYANNHTRMAYEGFAAGWQASRQQFSEEAAKHLEIAAGLYIGKNRAEVLAKGSLETMATHIRSLTSPIGDKA